MKIKSPIAPGHVRPEIRSTRRNIIKSGNATAGKVGRFSLPNIESDQPTIEVRQDVGGGNSLEFRCSCGCTTVVKLDYSADADDVENTSDRNGKGISSGEPS